MNFPFSLNSVVCLLSNNVYVTNLFLYLPQFFPLLYLCNYLALSCFLLIFSILYLLKILLSLLSYSNICYNIIFLYLPQFFVLFQYLCNYFYFSCFLIIFSLLCLLKILLFICCLMISMLQFSSFLSLFPTIFFGFVEISVYCCFLFVSFCFICFRFIIRVALNRSFPPVFFSFSLSYRFFRFVEICGFLSVSLCLVCFRFIIRVASSRSFPLMSPLINVPLLIIKWPAALVREC